MTALGITDAECVDDNDKQIKKSIGFEKRDLIIGDEEYLEQIEKLRIDRAL